MPTAALRLRGRELYTKYLLFLRSLRDLRYKIVNPPFLGGLVPGLANCVHHEFLSGSFPSQQPGLNLSFSQPKDNPESL